MSTPRRLTKLAFVGLIGDTAFKAVLAAAKVNVDLEAFVKLIDWATPEADGTSVDLDDPRTVVGLQALEAAGFIAPGRAAEILAVAPEPEAPITPAFVTTHRITLHGTTFDACVDGDTVRLADGKWSTLTALAAMGATVEVI